MNSRWFKCSMCILAVLSVCLLTGGPVAAKTVKIGVIAPFSGGYARWGEQFQQAIEVFQSDFGDSVNGNKVELIYRDIGGIDPAKSKRFAEELIIRDKVKFLAGFCIHAQWCGGGFGDQRSQNSHSDIQCHNLPV